MRIAILGADGYLGRPTMMKLEENHSVIGLDNYLKDEIMSDCRVLPLNNPKPYKIIECDITQNLTTHLDRFEPDVVIHYGEISSAPFSMVYGWETLENNIKGTYELVEYARKHDIHIIKLGTMGEYGTPNIDIEEGWLDIEHNGRKDRVLYPKKPHSIYHLSKVTDSDMLAFGCRVWGLRVTDLNQGVVYGNYHDDDRASRFCYDDIFGTALNRFIVQAVAGIPLTVYGTGHQTRGWLDIKDTIQCVELAVNNPPERGEFRVMNQFTQQFSVKQLAEMVKDAAESMGIRTKIDHIENPRTEQESHYYNAKHSKLIDLGLSPHLLTDERMAEMIQYVESLKHRINPDQIQPTITWC